METIRNRVQLIGRVGRDPEILNLEGGSKLAKFSLATNENYTNNKGEKVERTQWHYIMFWNRSAEIIEQYVNKGQQIAVEGRLSTSSWEDKDGIKHYRTEVIGNGFLMLGK